MPADWAEGVPRVSGVCTTTVERSAPVSGKVLQSRFGAHLVVGRRINWTLAAIHCHVHCMGRCWGECKLNGRACIVLTRWRDGAVYVVQIGGRSGQSRLCYRWTPFTATCSGRLLGLL